MPLVVLCGGFKERRVARGASRAYKQCYLGYVVDASLGVPQVTEYPF